MLSAAVSIWLLPDSADYREDFTDDASVVEAMGISVELAEGNRENIKITTPFDMVVAEALCYVPIIPRH